jgi:hypothetical protein
MEKAMPDSSAGKDTAKWAVLAVLLLVGYAVSRYDSCQSRRAEVPQPTPVATASPQPAGLLSADSDPAADTYDPASDRSEEAVRLNIRQANKSITYEHLKKNADRYDGEPWAFTGRILQVQEAGGQTTALVSLDSWGSKTMYVRASFTTEFVEKDQVYVVGYLAGNYSYTSVAGWNLTVPALDARAILKPAEAARLRGKKSTK